MAKIINLRSNEIFEGPAFATSDFNSNNSIISSSEGFRFEFSSEEKKTLFDELNFMEECNKEWREKGNTEADTINPDSPYMKFLEEKHNG